MRARSARKRTTSRQRQKQITAPNSKREQHRKTTISQSHHQNTQQHQLLAQTNHKENSTNIQLSNQPTKTSRLRDRTATQRKKKREKNFFLLLCDRNNKNLNQQRNASIDSSLVSKQLALLLASRLQSLSAHVNHSSQHRAPKEKNVLLWSRTTNSTMTKHQRRKEPSDSR